MTSGGLKAVIFPVTNFGAARRRLGQNFAEEEWGELGLLLANV